MAEKQYTAAERAYNFAQFTRQNLQAMPTKSFTAEGDRIQFTLPKARLLANTVIMVEAVVKLSGGDKTVPVVDYPAAILSRVSLDLNNGFMPFVLSGRDLNIYDMIRMYPGVAAPSSDDARAAIYVENTATSAGKENKIKIILPLRNVLSEKDSVGLWLLQNETTQTVLTIDLDKLQNAYDLSGAGVTASFVSCKVTPFLETFTIPAVSGAVPDLSTIKLVSSKYDEFSANSQSILKMPVGTIYRKIALYFENADGTPMTADDFAGNIEMIFNQADIPISLNPKHIEYLNQHYYGRTLPAGVFVLDFAAVPLPNLATSRDLVDTERLTEFWIRFTAKNAGKVTAINETISRLSAAQ